MKGLINLREVVHNKILVLRSIENILARPKFIRLWHDSNECEQAFVICMATEGKKEEILKWINEHPSLDLGDKTLTQLRDIAKRLGVKYYAQLMHGELVSEILKKEIGNE